MCIQWYHALKPLDTTVHVRCLRIWGQKSVAFLHVCFSVLGVKFHLVTSHVTNSNVSYLMDTDDISGNIAVLHNLVSLSNKFIPASLLRKYQYWLTNAQSLVVAVELDRLRRKSYSGWSVGLELQLLFLGGTKATVQSNKKAPRRTSGKEYALKVDNGLRASRPNSKRARQWPWWPLSNSIPVNDQRFQLTSQQLLGH